MPAFALVLYAIWDFVFDGEGDAWRVGWSGVLVLVAALVAATARLLARPPRIVQLASAAAILTALATAVSIAAICVLGELDGLELVAGAAPGGKVVVELAGRSLVVRHDGEETRLAPGGRLALRSR